jgi:phosphohistidine phosphatase SixA
MPPCRLPLLLMVLLAGAAEAAPQTVILVRHAEKAVAPADDPALSPAGAARAAALAAALADAGVEQVLTTRFRRTRETAAPLAAARGLRPVVIDAAGDTAAHVAAVAAAVRAAAGTVLVVGHSNTVPAIIAALGGPALPPLCEGSYSRVFVLSGLDGAPRLQRWRYGADDAPAADGCQ